MPLRTHVRVERSDGRTFPSLAFAYRQLLGTSEELGYSEHQRMRARIRIGRTARDSRGFTWFSADPPMTAQFTRQPIVEAVEAALPADDSPSGATLWSDLTFGVELEMVAPFGSHGAIERLAQIGMTDWRVVHDGSVQPHLPGFSGFELVSPVLRGESGLTALTQVLTEFHSAGAKVNASCGLHVHIGVRELRPSAVRRIALAFVNAEAQFDAIVPPSRRANRFAGSNVARIQGNGGARRLERAQSISTIGACMNGGNSPSHYNSYRYHKLNFQSFVRHGTIEFRQAAGTTEHLKATSWVRLITGFCAAAISAPAQACTPNSTAFDALLQCVPEATQTFFRARRAKFAAPHRAAA